jgi:hypothetical protein
MDYDELVAHKHKKAKKDEFIAIKKDAMNDDEGGGDEDELSSNVSCMSVGSAADSVYDEKASGNYSEIDVDIFDVEIPRFIASAKRSSRNTINKIPLYIITYFFFFYLFFCCIIIYYVFFLNI